MASPAVDSAAAAEAYSRMLKAFLPLMSEEVGLRSCGSSGNKDSSVIALFIQEL